MLPFHPSHMFPLRRSESGAINITGAIAGLVITTAIGGVAAGSLIPAAQDSAAQQNASQLGAAQGLARIMEGAFTDTQGLESGGYLPPYRPAMGPRRFATQEGQGGNCFVVVSRSVTGKQYFTTDLILTPELLTQGTATGCLPEDQVQSMARSLAAAG